MSSVLRLEIQLSMLCGRSFRQMAMRWSDSLDVQSRVVSPAPCYNDLLMKQ